MFSVFHVKNRVVKHYYISFISFFFTAVLFFQQDETERVIGVIAIPYKIQTFLFSFSYFTYV